MTLWPSNCGHIIMNKKVKIFVQVRVQFNGSKLMYLMGLNINTEYKTGVGISKIDTGL